MSVAAWSMLWQIVLAATCVAFFTLAAWFSVGAISEAREMFHDLAGDDEPPEDD